MKNVMSFEEYSLNEGITTDKIKSFLKRYFADNLNGQRKVIDRVEREFGHLSKEEKKEKAKELAKKLKRDNISKEFWNGIFTTIVFGIAGIAELNTISDMLLTYIIIVTVNTILAMGSNLWIGKTVRDYTKK